LEIPNHRFERRLIFAFVVMILSTFLTRFHLAFWYPGIGGWDYRSVKSKGLKIENCEDKPGQPPWLMKSIDTTFIDRIPAGIAYPGNAMLFHFGDGAILPANYDLLGVVFPNELLGDGFESGRTSLDKKLAAGVVRSMKQGLDIRRENYRNLLPMPWAYPAHAVFRDIDYTHYPSSENLQKISFWRLSVCLNPSRQIKIVDYKMTGELHVN
jgi:hypothetical protein